MSDDDFEEILKTGASLAPCTVKCVRLGRHTNKSRTVSVTFRAALLPAEVVAVLQSPRLSAAYSPSQRAVRVLGNPAGAYTLSRAPRSQNVWLLRFPYKDNMPWVDKRTAVDVDVNVAQGAIFLDLGPIFDQRAAQPTLSPPQPSAITKIIDRGQRAGTTELDSDGRIFVTGTLCGMALDTSYRRLLWALSDGKKHDKPILLGMLAAHGFSDLNLSAMAGRVNKGLAAKGIEITESTDRRQVWLTPMALAAYRRHAA